HPLGSIVLRLRIHEYFCKLTGDAGCKPEFVAQGLPCVTNTSNAGIMKQGVFLQAFKFVFKMCAHQPSGFRQVVRLAIDGGVGSRDIVNFVTDLPDSLIISFYMIESWLFQSITLTLNPVYQLNIVDQHLAVSDSIIDTICIIFKLISTDTAF